MRRTVRAVLFLGTLPFAACAGPAPTPTDSAAAAPAAVDPAAVRQTLDSLNRNMVAAMLAKDTAGLGANYAADALIMMPGMPTVQGRDGWTQAAQGWFDAMDVKDPRFETRDLQVGGDLAVETGRYWMTVGPKGGPAAADSGKYVTVWQRQPDGGWRIIRDINNSDIAPKM